MLNKFIIIIFVSIFVSGCKVTPTKLVYSAPPSNKVINVYSLIPQDELGALYPVQNSSAVTAQFGLVGALVGAVIDTSVNMSNAQVAERNLEGIRNELINLEFDKLFEEEVSKKLVGKVNIGKIKTVKSFKELNKILKPDETYLLLETFYKMDIDFRTPFIVTSVSLNEKNKSEKSKKKKRKKKKKDTLLYKNTFTYFGLSLPAPIKSQESIDAEVDEINSNFAKLSPRAQKSHSKKRQRQRQINKASKTAIDFDDANVISARAWSTEYKEELNSNLRDGIQQLFTIISNDIADKTPPESYAKIGSTLEGYPAYHKAVLVDETKDRKIIRFSDGYRAGAICSMPKAELTSKLLCL